MRQNSMKMMLLLVFLFAGCLYAEEKPPADFWCGFDIDGDGIVSESEKAKCAETMEGDFCPLGGADCATSYVPAECPGGVLNGAADKCENDPVIICPDGYSYDFSSDMCAADATCPDGKLPDLITDTCRLNVAALCYGGYAFDASKDKCLKDLLCPSGGTYNVLLNRCEYQVVYSCPEGYLYNNSTVKCERSPMCAIGVYDGAVDLCATSYNRVCPENYPYNSQYAICIYKDKYYCPAGTTLNTSNGYCTEPQSSLNCKGAQGEFPGGYFDSSLGWCRTGINPSCPYGGTYNATTDTCVTKPAKKCPTGYTYYESEDGKTVGCITSYTVTAPACPSLKYESSYYGISYLDGGTLQEISGSYRCVRGALNFSESQVVYYAQCGNCKGDAACWRDCIDNTLCPGGWGVWRYVNGNWTLEGCESDIICKRGGYYSPERDMCVIIPNVAVAQCPGDAWSYDNSLGTYGMCTTSIMCPQGFTDMVDKKCVIPYTGGCTGSYVYDANSGKCTSPPICPDGSSYSDNSNLCVANPGMICPSSVYALISETTCRSVPVCDVGSSYNAERKKCMRNALLSCPDGLSWLNGDASTGLCGGSVSCPDGGTLNSSIGRCEKPSWDECPQGYAFGPDGVCRLAPPCPIGSVYDPTLDKCAQETLPVCPVNYAYDKVLKICWAKPSCIGESVYNGEKDRCEYQPPVDYFCPVNNMTYTNPIDCVNNCKKTAQCTLTTPNFTGETGGNGCPASGSGKYKMYPDGNKIYVVDSVSGVADVTSTPCVITGSAIEFNYCGNYVAIEMKAVSAEKIRVSGRAYNDAETLLLWSADWTVSKCLVSETLSIYGASNKKIGLKGSGDTLYPVGVYQLGETTTAGYLKFAPVYLCSLGDYACDANNMCTQPVACLALVSCPEIYTGLDGTICTVEASCPGTGAVLNYSTDRCENAADYKCPKDFVLSGMQCVAGVKCPNGGVLDANSDFCVNSSNTRCPAGYALEIISAGEKICHTQPLCPSGTAYNVFYNMCAVNVGCPTGYAGDSLGYCVKDPVCFNEGVFLPEIDACETDSVPFCKSGWTYSSTYNVCLYGSSCEGTGLLNHSTDRCEVTSSCPANYYLNENMSRCEAEPICPDSHCPDGYKQDMTGKCRGLPKCYEESGSKWTSGNYAYNSTTYRCEVTPGCALDGYAYDKALGRCVGPLVCMEGWTAVDGYCRKNPDSCSYGAARGAWDSASKQCMMLPSCVYSGEIYDTKIEKCAMTPLCPEYFKDSWIQQYYKYNSAMYKCEGPPKESGSCPAYYYWDAAIEKCVSMSEATTCYSGQTYYRDARKCISTPTSSNCYWWYAPNYDTAAKRCTGPNSYQLAICDYGGFNSTVKQCQYTSYSCPNGYYRSVAGGVYRCFSNGIYEQVAVCPAGYAYERSSQNCYRVNDCSPDLIPENEQGYNTSGYVRHNTTGQCFGDVISKQFDKNLVLCTTKTSWCGNLSVPPKDGYCCPAGSSFDSGICIAGEGDCPTTSSNVSIQYARDMKKDLCVGGVGNLSCPSGYTWDYADGYCVKLVQEQINCPLNSAYSSNLDACYRSFESAFCPQYQYYNLFYDLCFSSARCPGASWLDSSVDTCVSRPLCSSIETTYDSTNSVRTCSVYACPASIKPPNTFSWNSGRYWWGGSQQFCYTYQSLACPGGTWYQYQNGYKCMSNSSCPLGGNLNKSTNLCEASTRIACPTGYEFNADKFLCVGSVPSCEGGTIVNGKCQIDASTLCPSGYQYYPDTDECVMVPPYCPNPGVYSYENKDCRFGAEYLCPTAEYFYDSAKRLCLMDPVCATVYNPEQNACYGSAPRCPLGDYACMNYGGVYKCSPYSCVDASRNILYADFTPDEPADDGVVNEQGDCSGQFYIFSGKGGYCRPPGIETSYTNCCSYDMGEIQCAKDMKTTYPRDAGKCRYIGGYCKKKWDFIGCVQEAESYCCFDSKLARIVNEQGRPQLKSFGSNGGWGEPKSPNCRGFTPEEFQMLDWTKIDLSEYFNDLKKGVSDSVGQGVKDKLNKFYK